uniref:ShKT domain-containing protein n=1 Tax=Acrobeloides nanus TaxID=290746 RepID=A0A914CG44_9BILA
MQELLQVKQEQHGIAEFGVNDLMDWSKEEKANLARLTSMVKPQPNEVMPPSNPTRVKRQTPANYDWRTYNKVTSVKNQGNCGSCWAFATTAVVESAWAIKNGSLLNLSEQNLVSCISQNSGCQGGYPPYALVYTRTQGITSEAAYPYTASNGTCTTVAGKTVTTDWWYVGTNESELTNQVVTQGPLVYRVYKPNTSECQTAANNGAGHAITVVGYGTDTASGYPYWLIKNSWGTGWGNAGYFKLYRGTQLCSMGNSMWAASATAATWTCSNVEDEDDCKYWQGLGYCNSSNQYYSYMQSNCKAACGWCSSG